jgi:hypothetical protein
VCGFCQDTSGADNYGTSPTLSNERSHREWQQPLRWLNGMLLEGGICAEEWPLGDC